jgi:replicative DNA helicase
MEMTTLVIAQRLAAMQTNTPLTQLLKASLSTSKMKHMKEGLQAMEDNDTGFYLLDGNLASTGEDVAMLAHQLKPDIVLVDGAYLLGHSDKRIGKWEKQSANAELLKKDIATGMGIPVVASYQFGKDSNKKKKPDEDLTMDDVYGSDAMAQLSSVMFGLFEMDTSVAAMKRRRVSILKGRNGEAGSFYINWDFYNMNFEETVNQEDKPSNTLQFC